MLSQIFVQNLVYAITEGDVTDLPVAKFDIAEKKPMPCVVVGYDSEEPSFSARCNHGHSTVSGWVLVEFQGYDDLDTSEQLAESKAIWEFISGSDVTDLLNKPAALPDKRPYKDFHCHRISLQSVDSITEGHSNSYKILFTAYVVGKDLPVEIQN